MCDNNDIMRDLSFFAKVQTSIGRGSVWRGGELGDPEAGRRDTKKKAKKFSRLFVRHLQALRQQFSDAQLGHGVVLETVEDRVRRAFVVHRR